MKAMSLARDMAQQALNDTSATKVTMPFVEDNLLMVKRLMGENFWSYGIAGNEKVIEAFCDMHFRQGLSPRRLVLNELFHPATFETYSL